MSRIPKTTELFDLTKTIAQPLLRDKEYPHMALSEIKAFIYAVGATLSSDDYYIKGEGIWIAKSAKVADSVSFAAPCIIGAGAEIRHSAFIRGAAIIGEGVVFGNSCEIKNSIIFNDAQVPHFNYVGDSILGYHAHMGAGSITSNVKSDKSDVKVKFGSETLDTGLKKFGAMLGDFCEIGCNAVMNPGTIVGRNSTVYPLSLVRGVIPADSIYKQNGNVVAKTKTV
jgi:NDP-sugar pyrophosphorylase family protein